MPISVLVRDALEKLRLKLLDLSNRNRLLNFKFSDSSRKFVRVIDEIPGLLYDRLTGESGSSGKMYFEALPEPIMGGDDVNPEDTGVTKSLSGLDAHQAYSESEASGRKSSWGQRPQGRAKERINLADWASKNGIDPTYDLPTPAGAARENHADNKIQTLMLPETLSAKMARIRDDARLSEQEQGISTLHTAFGFLEWYEDATSKEARFAPLLLLPVQIDRELKNHQYRYFMECGEAADPASNISLRERLKKDLGFALPELNETEGPEEYMGAVERAIRIMPRWRVRRFVVVGHFSFARLVMYQDLQPESWGDAALEDQPLIQDLLAGAEAAPESTFAEDYETEAPEVEALVPVLLMDADSSQYSAIVDAMRGRSFALKGPPGTGKSQTITNLIAAALAAQKKVLFVAEKLAALEVVSKRLADAGLGPFMLELHSTKSQKKRLIQSFEARLAIQSPRTSKAEDLAEELKELGRTRAQLHHYANLLNSEVGASAISLHDALWHEQRRRNGLNLREAALSAAKLTVDVSLQPPSALAASRSATRQLVASLRLCAGAEGNVKRHALYGLWGVSTDPAAQEAVRKWLDELATAVSSVASVRARVESSLHVDFGETTGSAKCFCERIAAMPTINAPRTDLLGRISSVDEAKQVKQALDTAARALPLFERLAANLMDPHKDLNTAGPTAVAAAALKTLGGSLGWDDINFSVVPRAVRAQAEQLTRQRKVLNLLSRWGEQIGLIAPMDREDIASLAKALRLLHQTPPEVLKLRHSALYSSETPALLKKTSQTAESLKKNEEALATEAQLTYRESGPALTAAAATIEGTSVWLRLFSGDYRASVKLYRSLSLHKWHRETAPARLKVWASAVQKHQDFAQDAALAASLGPAFSGLTTPFTTMSGVIDFCAAVRKAWPLLDSDKAKIQHALLQADLAALEGASGSFSSEDVSLLESLHEWLLEEKSSSVEHVFEAREHALKTASLLFRELSTIGWCIDPTLSTVARVAKDREMAATLLADLSRSRVAELMTPGGRLLAQGDLERLRSTVDYAETVLQSGLPTNAIDLLMSAKTTQAAAAFRQFASLVSQAVDNVDRAVQRLQVEVGLNLDHWCLGMPEHSLPLVQHLERAREAGRVEQVQFGDWAILCEARNYLLGGGATDLCQAVLDGGVRLERAEQCLERLYFRTLIHAVGERVPRFRGWTGTKMQELRTRLVELDREFMSKSTALLKRKLAATSVPVGVSRGPKKDLTERSLIENEVGKQSRHIPIRALMGRAFEAAQALKPCFMMSPASVSQFLRQSPATFDLVIIDEASQMRPEDSLAALARTKQIVVVGDPMQLPPTTFFDSIQDETVESEDDEELSVDTESILDLALSKLRPPRDLRWHYRSRHESLIAFSNRQFYQDRLIVFPSPVAKASHLGVQLLQVPEGLYRASLNQKEAETVVQAVRALVHENPNRSIGVVAVNQPQRDLLSDEFDRLFAEDEVMEDYRAKWSGTLEDFFVNNLENVQGHERDVIVISTVYGPETLGGPVFQRFGPINSKVGHRRLNVLFTRAKETVLLVTSLKAENIKTTPASPPGVQALRDYLEFARSGRLDSGVPTGAGHDSPFEAEVAQVLSQLGFRAAPQVGVAGFYIDLAVRHPQMHDHYVLGIECDGATYHSAKSARDRDRLRQEILERLGWKLHRIWSTDWYRGRDREIERLRERVVEAIASARGYVH